MRLDSCSTIEGKEKLDQFANWILAVGDCLVGVDMDGTFEINVLPELVVKGGIDPIGAVVRATYDNLPQYLHSNNYFNDRAILAPTIEMVQKINRHMCSMLPGDEREYISCDTVCKTSQDSNCFEDLYTTEFLNTVECSGLPPHKLVLKVESPVMLLCNIDQASGLCNGTQLRVTELGKTAIEAITLKASKPNQKVLIHRMDMNPLKSRWPFKMQQRQFLLTLSFAITINKSQGQSLCYVGLLLSKPVFTHRQLYVALSHVRSMEDLKVVVSKGDGNDNGDCKTTNVVYKEVFQGICDSLAP